MRLLDDDDVRALGARDAATALRAALVDTARGELVSPPRLATVLGDRRVLFGGGGSKGGPIGLRVSGSATSPLEHATLCWSADGSLEAVIVGNELGARRTGMVGALAADLLATAGPLRVGIVGSGRNGWAQIWALTGLREISDLAVYSPTTAHREHFAERASAELGLAARAAESARAAVEARDLVILCTTSPEPVIEADWVADGAHVTSVGPKSTSAHELPEELLRRVTRIVSDAPGELSSPVSDLAGLPRVDLGTLLLNGTVARAAREVTLFLISGLGVTDAAYAQAVAAAARA